ncbi:hypothetical protein AALO_G00054530 [Alosa alosa]|uniref:Uncharacterized protein n=1 Tax=Alosa alosa TaxID=278164 RepID=A0AAV6H8B7_9TELE|nr:hypothetical protein AALO_G00054530 [Alosa alosa]
MQLFTLPISILLVGTCVSCPLPKNVTWPCFRCEENCSRRDIHNFQITINNSFKINEKYMKKSIATWVYDKKDENERRIPRIITHAICHPKCRGISSGMTVPIQQQVDVYYQTQCERRQFYKLEKYTEKINLGCTCVVK